MNNILIVNLAISDLLLCSVATPVTVAGVLFKRWQLPWVQLLCQLSGMVPVCLVFVSTLTITGIAMDRYVEGFVVLIIGQDSYVRVQTNIKSGMYST